MVADGNPYTNMIDFHPQSDRRFAIQLLRRIGRGQEPSSAHDPFRLLADAYSTRPRLREEILVEVCGWEDDQVARFLEFCAACDDGEALELAGDLLERRGLTGIVPTVETIARRAGGARWLVEVLGDVHDDHSTRLLIGFMDHPDLPVRRRASDALCAHRGTVEVRALIRFLAEPLVRRRSHPDPMAAVRALQRLADPSLEPDFGRDAARRAEKVLINCVIHDRRADVRGDAIASLGEIGSRASVRCLVDMLHREDAAWHRDVVIALRKIRPDRALIALLGLLRSRDPIIREEAAHALGEIGDRQAARRLRDLLDDEDPDVRQEAVLALGKLGGRRVLEALERALSDPTAEVRIVACSALAESLGSGAERKLIRALYDLSPDVRAEAAYLLGELGQKEAEKHLEIWIDDLARDGFGNRVGAIARKALFRLAWARRQEEMGG